MVTFLTIVGLLLLVSFLFPRKKEIGSKERYIQENMDKFVKSHKVAYSSKQARAECRRLEKKYMELSKRK